MCGLGGELLFGFVERLDEGVGGLELHLRGGFGAFGFDLGGASGADRLADAGDLFFHAWLVLEIGRDRVPELERFGEFTFGVKSLSLLERGVDPGLAFGEGLLHFGFLRLGLGGVGFKLRFGVGESLRDLGGVGNLQLVVFARGEVRDRAFGGLCSAVAFADRFDERLKLGLAEFRDKRFPGFDGLVDLAGLVERLAFLEGRDGGGFAGFDLFF